MRKTLLLTLVLCVIAAVAYAQAPAATGTGTSTTTSTTTATTGTTGTTTTTTKTKTTKHHKAAAKKFKGYVNAVDPAAKSFGVSSSKNSQDIVTYKVNDHTKYSPKGKTFDDLKVGDRVSGTFKADGGDNWALSVHIYAAKAEKAAPAAKTGR
jgi:hypothetical protein